jgi:alpha-mannosidase
MSRTRVDVVVHTHWDREWYLPYQTTVARLAHVLEAVVSQLEAGTLQGFLFDRGWCSACARPSSAARWPSAPGT